MLAGMVLVCAALPVLTAHHLWLEKQPDRLYVCRGTFPDQFEAYGSAAIQGAMAFDASGGIVSLSRADNAGRAVFICSRPVALAAVWSDWGVRVNTTEGKKLMSKPAAEAAGLTVINTFVSRQYAKSSFDFSPALLRRMIFCLK
jgi:hypothetical protein